MSANNIVVIKKGDDGKFRGYHRDYDAHAEGQYEELNFCFCLVDVNPDELDTPLSKYLGAGRADPACEICKGTGYVPERSIFEVDTIEGAILAYDKWCQQAIFIVEYGYTFENLEPNAETVKAMEETDREEGLHTTDSVEELMKELSKPDDTGLLDTIRLENIAKECNRLKKILYDNRESMSNKDFIIIRGAILAENFEIGDSTVIEAPDDIRRILKARIEKIEDQIKRLVNDEKST